MLLKGEKVTVIKETKVFKKGQKLTVEHIRPVDVARGNDLIGQVIKFEEHPEEFPIALLEQGYIEESKKTETKIKNWFK